MNRLCVFLLLLLPVTGPAGLAAQEATEYRMEAGVGIGAGFSLNDVNSSFYGQTKAAGGALVRFILNPRMAIKTALSYTPLGGSTTNVENFYPARPGAAGTERLNFTASGGLTDLSALYEIHFLPYGYERGYQGFYRLVPYLQMGFGLTYSDAGDAFTVNFPIGFGLKYKIGRRLNLGLDWRIHFTLDDRLEGLEAPLGIPSGGFRNKDHYSVTLVTLTYDLAPRCPDCNKD